MYSKQSAVSDGTLVTLAITLEYQSRDEISVFFEPAFVGDWAWAGTTEARINFTPAVPDGTTVKVQRTTKINGMRHVFTAGAQFMAKTIDADYTQLLHLAQEQIEGAAGEDTGVSSFNARVGDIVLSAQDIEDALGFMPSEGGVAGVSSFGGRTGAVNLTKGDIYPLGITSFNTRIGDVVLTAADITATGFTSGSNTVLNVAEVRSTAHGGASVRTTRGYYLNGDGGAATYYRDPSDISSADNGGSVIVASDGARWKIAPNGVYSAKQFGAKGDSSYGVPGNDDTIPLQRLIDYIQPKGAIGYLPEGRYRCTNRLVIGGTCKLYGAGWKDVRDQDVAAGPNFRDWTKSSVIGTILYADFFTATAGEQIYVNGNSVSICDMEFEVNQPVPSNSSWTPNSVPRAIYAYRQEFYEQGGNSITIENVMLRNHTNGIKLYGVARGFLDNIYGQVFGVGIDVTKNGDVLRMNNLHFNWSFFSGRTATNAYMDANSQVVLLGRVDNPILSNMFTFGGLIGIHTYVDTVTPNGGSTFRLQCTNIGLDNIFYGLRLEDACSLSLSNFYVYNRAEAGSRGIYGLAVLGGGYTPQRINLVNGDFQGSMAEAIRLEVPGTANLANVQITDYNNSGGAFPGIAAYDGVTIQYVNLSNTTPSTTPLTQGFGTGVVNGPGGAGAGVASFNSRTGIVTLTKADVDTALGYNAARLVGGNSYTGVQTSTGTIQVTGNTLPSTGTGIELTYIPGSGGFVSAYNRGASAYTDITISAANITFQINGTNKAAFNTAGQLLLNYGVAQAGGHVLQANGDVLISGAAFAATPLTATTGTRVATCDYVIARLSASGVSSFNTRTGAVTLSSGDVTGALGYTPANSAATVASFNSRTGAVSLTAADVVNSLSGSTVLDVGATIRSTGANIPASGSGLELTFSGGTGYMTGYNRTSAVYTPVTIAGSAINFQINGSIQRAFDSSGRLLLGFGSSQGAAYNLQVNSQIFATSATIATSDARLKENVESLRYGLDVVDGLRPVAYDFKPHDEINFPKERQVGFLAQELELGLMGTGLHRGVVAVPEEDGQHYGVAEVKLIPFMVKAIQELSARVRELEAKEK